MPDERGFTPDRENTGRELLSKYVGIQKFLECGMQDGIFLGGGGEAYGEKQFLPLKYANRHGLVAGATGTGKTVTLQILAEGFSAAGVPVFLSDVKGDLSSTLR